MMRPVEWWRTGVRGKQDGGGCLIVVMITRVTRNDRYK